MALCEATCILPGVACAAVGATCLAPACLPAGALPPSLWILQVAALAPVIWCAFWSPAAALGAFGLSHSVEWDEHDGKFVGVEDDTIMFGPEGEALYGDVYCPMTAEDEVAVLEAQAETMRRRSIDATERAARGEDAEPDFVAFGLGRAAHACASVVACPGPADGHAAPPADTRLKDD